MYVQKIHPWFERDACCLLPFFSVQRWDKVDHGNQTVFSLQDSTLNAPQQTLNCMHNISKMSGSLAKTINIALLLQCIHWLIAVKSLDALGSSWLLYQGRIPLLPSFLWLTPSITASGKCNLPSHLPTARLIGVAPVNSFRIVFNNLIFLKLQSDYFSQSKYSLRRWGIIQLVCFPMKITFSIFTLHFLLMQHQSR